MGVTQPSASRTNTTNMPGPISIGANPAFNSATLNAVADFTTIPSAVLALNPDLFRLWASEQSYAEHVFGQNGGSVTAGTGASSGTTSAKIISSGAVFGGACSYFCNPILWTSNPGATTAIGWWNWNKVVVFSTRFSTVPGNAGVSTNGLFRTIIGRSNGAGALDQKGMGFGLIYASATTGSIVGYAHNGSSLTTTSALTTIDTSTTGYCHQVVGISDGAGNVYFFVDRVYAGTTTGGPTTIGQNGNYVVAEVLNNADSATNQFQLSSVRIWTKE